MDDRNNFSDRDASFDLVIIGSGAASVCASLVALSRGKRPLIIEKTDLVGGTTALSGGALWIPNNPAMKRAGVADSAEAARQYLDACVGPYSPGSTPERRAAFIEQGPEMVSFLEAQGMQFVHAEGWPDYHEGEQPGASVRGRTLVAEIFDLRELGRFVRKLRRPSERPPLRSTEGAEILLYGRTWRSKWAMARMAMRMFRNRLGSRLVGMGEALQGRLFKLAVDRNIPIWTGADVKGFIEESGRIVGVTVEHDGQTKKLRAQAVLVNAGGFSHNLDMRLAYQQHPIGTDWTLANPGDTGEMISMMRDAGGDIAAMDMSWWLPVSVRPDGVRTIVVADISKPHCIMVDAQGQRYVNESTSYGVLGLEMYAHNAQGRSIPSWAIFDRRHRERYFWAETPPGKVPDEWIDSGYIKVANTIEELAQKCGIEAGQLSKAVEHFNSFAASGDDVDFGRGRGAFHHFYGDPSVKPNPNLGPIDQPPFYAVQVFPGDVGTAGGVVTDEFGRVLRPSGDAIPGLYATGNCTASVMGYSYPAAGASIGPSMVFGYIAATHAKYHDNENISG